MNYIYSFKVSEGFRADGARIKSSNNINKCCIVDIELKDHIQELKIRIYVVQRSHS